MAEWVCRRTTRRPPCGIAAPPTAILPTRKPSLDTCTSAGRGVEKSQIEAERLFRRAAEQGHAVALVNLGFIHGSGAFGFAPDPALGYALVSHAADTGNQLAVSSLAELKAHLPPDQVREGQKLADT